MAGAPAGAGRAGPGGASAREYPGRPIVGVGGIVVRGDLVLLTRRGREPSLGEWTIPGGAVRAGERLRAAVAREVREETGLRVEAGPLVELLERIVPDAEGRPRYHYVLADFLCRLVPGSPTALTIGDDCIEGRWVPADDLGGLGVTPGTTEVVARAVAIARGTRPAEAGEVFAGRGGAGDPAA